MKNAINILMKVGRILDIIFMVIFIVVGAISLISGVVGGVAAIGAAGIAGTEAEREELIVAGGAAIGAGVSGLITSLIYAGLCIAGLIILKKKVAPAWNTAKTKAELKKPAIFAIVSGFLTTVCVGVAGILMLVMKEEDLPGYAAPVEVESTPAE